VGEKVITEALLRKQFLKELPETFTLTEGQLLTPAAAQFLNDRKVSVVLAKETAGAGYVAVEDGNSSPVKPEHMTHLIGRQLVPKDHPRIIFRGLIDNFQAEVLLQQQREEQRGNLLLSKQLEDLLRRAQEILKAEVTGNELEPCDFLGLSEAEIRERSHTPQKYYGFGHLDLSAELSPEVLSLNRLRTLIRQVELAAVTAFRHAETVERTDILQALNRLSSVIYVMMLVAVGARGQTGERMDDRLVDEVVAKVMACFETPDQQIPVELSARHVHLSAADVATLFGHDLTDVRELSQPGQFLCQERVKLIGPRGEIENIAVLGPARGRTQVEISFTDARILGANPPVRQSGDVVGSAGIQIATERATIALDEGLIVAARHIHMHPDDAQRFGVRDKDMVRVQVGDVRTVTFEETLVRVNPEYRLAMHIDFDEGNACGWVTGMTGKLLN
jgi:propanediol utilization protein/ethanolamine utilization cobalamin adenosyltransferase